MALEKNCKPKKGNPPRFFPHLNLHFFFNPPSPFLVYFFLLYFYSIRISLLLSERGGEKGDVFAKMFKNKFFFNKPKRGNPKMAFYKKKKKGMEKKAGNYFYTILFK